MNITHIPSVELAKTLTLHKAKEFSFQFSTKVVYKEGDDKLIIGAIMFEN